MVIATQTRRTPRARSSSQTRRSSLHIRWYERAPYLPGPNAHGEPWTRCSLGEDGSVDSCRTYCASQRARAASDALRFGMEAFTAHKSGLDPDARAAAVEALSDALSLLPGLSLAQVLLAHALYDGAEIDEARVCDLCARFLADYPSLKGVSEDAAIMLDECSGAFPPNTLFRLRSVQEGGFEAPSGVFVKQRLLTVSATFRPPRQSGCGRAMG